jgi:predicted O-methyltransferase YrrM
LRTLVVVGTCEGGQIRPKELPGVSERMKKKVWAKMPEPVKDKVFEFAVRKGLGRFKDNHRLFDYDRRLLANPYLAELESASSDLETAVKLTGLSIGYPAWNLLYYAVMCSLPATKAVVVETGTNQGFSTIVMAQVLKDAGGRERMWTVDIDPDVVPRAKANVEKAGLSGHVEFSVGDSIAFLRDLVDAQDHIDFAFLDGNHEFEHVVKEFELIYPRVVSCRGKVYFDNTVSGGVADALRHIQDTRGGNLVRFDNCSWSPPGNAIWQP